MDLFAKDKLCFLAVYHSLDKGLNQFLRLGLTRTIWHELRTLNGVRFSNFANPLRKSVALEKTL
jgi:hypothetical protein